MRGAPYSADGGYVPDDQRPLTALLDAAYIVPGGVHTFVNGDPCQNFDKQDVPDEPHRALLHDEGQRPLLPLASEDAPLPRARRDVVRLHEGEVTSRDELLAQKARHLAFVEERLRGVEAEGAWRENVTRAVEALLDAPLGEVAPPAVIAGALERIANAAMFDAIAAPLAAAIEGAVIAEISADASAIGDHVPEDARRALTRLLARRGLAPERLIRETCQQEAARELMREILSDALREFQTRVNPFSAEWGLPALLKKLSPFGFGVGKTFDVFRADFERRLEPEMKKFLQGASRHALARMTEMTVAKWDEPSFVALREELLRWALAQPVRDLTAGVPRDVFADARAAALHVARGLLLDPALAARRRVLVREIVLPRAGLRVRDALADIGARIEIDAAAIADLTWPAAKTALGSPAARAWFASLVTDFYDAEVAALPPAAG